MECGKRSGLLGDVCWLGLGSLALEATLTSPHRGLQICGDCRDFLMRAMPTESESPEWKPEPLILISSSPALQQLLSPLPDDTEPVTLDTESLPRSSPWGEESHGEWNEQDSEDRDSLRRHGVTHILSVHNRAKPVLEDMTYLCISASDSSSQNLIQHFKESIKFIHECRLRGGGCLVHWCHQGWKAPLPRSATSHGCPPAVGFPW
ncbi:uncharacterized protein DUSP22AL isoform X8 [Gallus gallus]|uniref:uncharacterized protein DUSP22AL isoform X8 n=1 Tax=Gallus gallus TaxID=9031 RepID=UPI000739E6D6|nr:uncharacterized protein DUSP22AL isoform X8 [Gallus gallus]|eukprot:XP_015148119.1 uncharacterized protein DUSP22AL isoform X5 [Gallus gallus]